MGFVATGITQCEKEKSIKTNANKYLKDDVNYKDLFIDFDNFLGKHLYNSIEQAFEDFMESEAKPILTEDEKVILMNIREVYSIIGKDEYEDIVLKKVGDDIKIAN